jgi:uncharacterized protein
MRFNIAQLLKEPIGSTRSYLLDETLAGPEPLTGRVRGRVSILRTHQGVLVRLEAEAPIALSCSRCLTPFAATTSFTSEEEFFPLIDVNTGRPVPLPEDADGAFRIGADHVLDLTEMVRQGIITETPMKPLCHPQCRGLCPECGANLNQGECSCGAARRGAMTAPRRQKQP